MKIDCDWNRFIDRTIDEAPQREEEKNLYALFFYLGEVMNGGRLQYFHNGPDPRDWKNAAAGAREIGQAKIVENLDEAAELWSSQRRMPPENAEEYAEEALEAEFEKFDNRFYELEPELMAAFEAAVEEKGE